MLPLYFHLAFSESIFFITLAGMPATIALAGTSFVTIAPAATLELSPIFTPHWIRELSPTHTFSPIITGA